MKYTVSLLCCTECRPSAGACVTEILPHLPPSPASPPRLAQAGRLTKTDKGGVRRPRALHQAALEWSPADSGIPGGWEGAGPVRAPVPLTRALCSFVRVLERVLRASLAHKSWGRRGTRRGRSPSAWSLYFGGEARTTNGKTSNMRQLTGGDGS